MEIGGIRTNFRMPDTLSIGLGGGSLIRTGDGGAIRVGPQSVDYELTSKAKVFGGDTLTTTDICVAAGHVAIGDTQAVTDIDPALIKAVEDKIEEMINIAVDRMKTSALAMPVIIVGGGSILVHRPVTGASEIVKPNHFAVANAIGAAIAQIGDRGPRAGAVRLIFWWPTLLVMAPTNKALGATTDNDAGTRSRVHLVKWGELHAVRTFLGLAGASAFLFVSVGR